RVAEPGPGWALGSASGPPFAPPCGPPRVAATRGGPVVSRATGAATRSVDPATRGVDIPRAPAALTEPAGRPRPLLAAHPQAGPPHRPRAAGHRQRAGRRPERARTLPGRPGPVPRRLRARRWCRSAPRRRRRGRRPAPRPVRGRRVIASGRAAGRSVPGLSRAALVRCPAAFGLGAGVDRHVDAEGVAALESTGEARELLVPAVGEDVIALEGQPA